MIKTKDIGTLLVVGEDFMEIMEDYQDRQRDDPNFDPRNEIVDLYYVLVQLYEANKS